MIEYFGSNFVAAEGEKFAYYYYNYYKAGDTWRGVASCQDLHRRGWQACFALEGGGADFLAGCLPSVGGDEIASGWRKAPVQRSGAVESLKFGAEYLVAKAALRRRLCRLSSARRR